MPLLPCRLCGKVFTSSGGRTCSACHTRLDELYPRVRRYLRDNPKVNFNVEAIAEEMEADIRDVQSLVDMGYLDRDVGKQTNTEETKRQKLAKEFEDSLKQMKDTPATNKAPVSYGQQRYGDKKK